MQTMSSLEVCWLAKFVVKVRRCCSLLTLVDKESELEVNSLRCLQPVQLAAECTVYTHLPVHRNPLQNIVLDAGSTPGLPCLQVYAVDQS